ncbi:MAG: EamA family transporter [Gammaproteobacteria bacterium]|nr:EamA family transporter [Gammaproteobacteria bacterium]
MSLLLITLVLSAAILHATWNALVKSGGVPEFSIAAYKLFGAVICLLLAPFLPLPDRESWWLIFASVVIHNLYYFTMAQAYRVGDLSQVYPLFRGLAPILVAIGAAIFAGESLETGTLIGIILISTGLMSITFFSQHFGSIPRPALFWGLVTGMLIAAYTIVDGIGVRLAGNPLSYIIWLFIFEPVPIGGWLVATQRKAWFDYMRTSTLRILFGSVCSGTAYGLVIFAMSLGAMAVVSSLRETSVIFAALIGTLLLGEPFGRQRIIAASLVAIGIVAMRLL